MARHTDWHATPLCEQNEQRRSWWKALLHWLGGGGFAESEHKWLTDEPQPELWTAEESRVLQRYHARNLVAARRATEHLVREGWHTGSVPYGYRAQRIWTSPHGRRSRYRTRLLIEPVEASVVKMIFLWQVHDGLGVEEIVKRLNTSRYPAPIRAGATEPSLWVDGVVTAILANPKYTGYQVWGRTHHGNPVPVEQWVWSGPRAHPPVIDIDTFLAAQWLSARNRTTSARTAGVLRAA